MTHDLSFTCHLVCFFRPSPNPEVYEKTKGLSGFRKHGKLSSDLPQSLLWSFLCFPIGLMGLVSPEIYIFCSGPAISTGREAQELLFPLLLVLGYLCLSSARPQPSPLPLRPCPIWTCWLQTLCLWDDTRFQGQKFKDVFHFLL